MNFINMSSSSTLHPRENSSLTYGYGSQQTANQFYKQTDFYSLGKKQQINVQSMKSLFQFKGEVNGQHLASRLVFFTFMPS